MTLAAPPAPGNSIHLVLGDSAVGCVRAACASCGMPGAVVGFFDGLAHGPLDDKALGSQWRALIARLELEQADAVTVWSGDNVGDAIFEAMACDQLAGWPGPLLRVRVPEIDGRPFVAMHSPEQLSQLYAMRRPLTAAERLSLAQEFARIRDSCGPLRRLEQGRVQGVPVDYYDSLVLSACTADWQAAGRVVGAAMGHCDGPNLTGDGFFRTRLGFLIDARRIEANGRRARLPDYSVRLANNQR